VALDEFATYREQIELRVRQAVEELSAVECDRLHVAITRARTEGISIRDAVPGLADTRGSTSVNP
jgi:hypothetical protein